MRTASGVRLRLPADPDLVARAAELLPDAEHVD
jgi:hypothetical protein